MRITIKKGLDLKIVGSVVNDTVASFSPESVAIFPDDFAGFTPKTCVKPGDIVSVGSPLLHDKAYDDLCLTSPVSGVVREVTRGERRRIVKVVVDGDGQNTMREFDVPTSNNEEAIAKLLANSGLMSMISRRPYAIVANPDDRPTNIFVTAFDSAPLAVTRHYNNDEARLMTKAVKALGILAREHIYISRRSEAQLPDVEGAVMVDVKGPHPAGNPGVQAANIAPVNKGEVIWTLSADTLMRIGQLMTTGHLDMSTTVAIVGSRVVSPTLVKTTIGAQLSGLLAGRLVNDEHHTRIISGNVLVGIKTEADSYLHFPSTQITAIPEGDDVDEFMGWASLSPRKMSISPSFPGHFFTRLFNPDARVLGGRRAMIMSGLIDRVLPMDIMGEYLIKAINARDIDRMEQLGIYEVAPEDFALAECIDSSKMPLQEIVRQGLDYLRQELG